MANLDQLQEHLDKALASGAWQEAHAYLCALAAAIARLNELGDHTGLAHVCEAYELGAVEESVLREHWQQAQNARTLAEKRRRHAQAKAVPCSKCGATAGQMCRTTSGQRAEEPHAVRRREA